MYTYIVKIWYCGCSGGTNAESRNEIWNLMQQIFFAVCLRVAYKSKLEMFLGVLVSFQGYCHNIYNYMRWNGTESPTVPL